MIVRLAGCAFIVCACLLWSFDRSSKLRNRIDALDSICRFITYTKREIEYFSTPFPIIFRTFKDGIFEYYANEENISAIAEDMPLTYEEREKFAGFLKSVGKSFPEAEIRSCNAVLEYFAEVRDFAKEDCPRRIKIERSLALLVGATLAILVI